MGYEVNNRYGKLSIKGKQYKRNIRIERYFGSEYSIENINKQILGMHLPIIKNYSCNKVVSNDIIKNLFKPKFNSFYSLYIRYCNILGNYPKYVKKHYISPSLRNDINLLDEISSHAIFLAQNNITNEEQFFSFIKSKEIELDNFKNLREDLWKKIKRVSKNEQEDIKKQLREIRDKIKPITEELKMCEKIRIKKDSIKENLENLKDKEMVINEHIK